MRLRPVPALCLALLLLGLTWSLSGPGAAPLSRGDESTLALAAQSLLHDRDLSYDQRDAHRAGRLWSGGPAGLTLFTNDGGRTMFYGRSLAWPMAALPFYAVLGERGGAVFNMALFLLVAGAALWLVREEGGLPALFAAGFFFASAAFGYAVRTDSPVLVGACLFFALLLWQKLRELPDQSRRDLRLLAGTGVLLGAVFAASPPAAILGLPVLIDLLWRRRWADAFTVLASALLVVGFLAVVQWRLTGEWNVEGGAQRRTFDGEYPLEAAGDLWQGYREIGGADLETGLRLLPRNLGYLLAGRHAGLLPYFPFALLAMALYFAGPKNRARILLAGAVAVYCLSILLTHPHDFDGGSGALGNRFVAAIYPAFFLLPGRRAVRRGLVLPYAAAGLWTAGAVLATMAPGLSDPAVRLGTFRILPLELTLLGGAGGGQVSDFTAQTWGGAVWIVPRWSFYTEERHPNGVWVRGATRSEVVVVSPNRLDRLRFTVYALSPENELVLDSGVDRLRVRFDTEGKRLGTPVDLAVEPVARDLGFFPSPEGEFFYRFTLTTTGGLVPARVDPKSLDLRSLGVFLDFTGEGP
ncbi:MAG TPA: hypothetical protein VE685_18010 [Thermoanaerobaculia bacterium]|nr:hypothetical protein [Thermoanaerobaculia bacterium]